MAISSLRLQNLRLYKDESFEFDPGVNIIVGPNARGKTTLLESIYALSRGSSWRGRDAELISFEHEWARLDGYFNNHTRTIKYTKLSPETLQKTYDFDDVEYKRLTYNHIFPVVLFEPNDLQLLIRGPQFRRDYIDSLLEQSNPHYKALLANYRRVLAQRNALLKRKEHKNDELFVWNLRLSELGGAIVGYRLESITNLNEHLGSDYSAIVQKNTQLTANYISRVPLENYSSALLKLLEKSTELDKQRGFTAYGPHRDDLTFLLSDEPAEQTASRGETRTILLTLKLYELRLLESARGIKPLLLLDDVFSELDGARRRYLVEFLKSHQTLITTTDADAVIEHFAKGYNLLALT